MDGRGCRREHDAVYGAKGRSLREGENCRIIDGRGAASGLESGAIGVIILRRIRAVIGREAVTIGNGPVCLRGLAGSEVLQRLRVVGRQKMGAAITNPITSVGGRLFMHCRGSGVVADFIGLCQGIGRSFT